MATAYQGGDKTVVVLINAGSDPVANIGIPVSGSATVNSYVTTLLMDRQVSSIQPKDGKAVLSLQAKSVTTVVIEN